MFLDFLPNSFDSFIPFVCIALTDYFIFPPTVEKYRNCKPVTETSDAQKSADPLINLDSEYSLPRTSFQSPVLLLWDGGGWLKKPAWGLKWLSKHVWTNWLHTHLSPQPTMSGLNWASDPQLEERSKCHEWWHTGRTGFTERKILGSAVEFFFYYGLGLSSWFLWNPVSATE